MAQLASSASRNKLPCMGCKWSGVYYVEDEVRVGGIYTACGAPTKEQHFAALFVK